MSWHQWLAYPVPKRVYLQHGWLGLLNYILYFAVMLYVLVYVMLYKKAYMDCDLVKSSPTLGNPYRVKGLTNHVCAELGNARSQGAAFAGAEGLYFRTGCRAFHGLPYRCFLQRPETRGRVLALTMFQFSTHDIQVPVVVYDAPLDADTCQALMDSEPVISRGNRSTGGPERCEESYRILDDEVFESLAEIDHYDADLDLIHLPLTISIDPSQAARLNNSQLCATYLPDHSSDATGSCGNGGSVVVEEYSCVPPFAQDDTSITFVVTLATIMDSITQDKRHMLSVLHREVEPHMTQQLQGDCQRLLSIGVAPANWPSAAHVKGLSFLWTARHHLISGIDRRGFMNNAQNYTAYQELVDKACASELAYARMLLMATVDIHATATFENTRGALDSFNGPFTPVSPYIHLNSTGEVRYEFIDVTDQPPEFLNEYQRNQSMAMMSDLLANNSYEMTDVSLRGRTLTYGIQMVSHVVGKVCFIDPTYTVLILLQAVTLVSLSATVMSLLILYVLPHKADYHAYICEEAHRFEAPTWLSKLCCSADKPKASASAADATTTRGSRNAKHYFQANLALPASEPSSTVVKAQAAHTTSERWRTSLAPVLNSVGMHNNNIDVDAHLDVDLGIAPTQERKTKQQQRGGNNKDWHWHRVALD